MFRYLKRDFTAVRQDNEIARLLIGPYHSLVIGQLGSSDCCHSQNRCLFLSEGGICSGTCGQMTQSLDGYKFMSCDLCTHVFTVYEQSMDHISLSIARLRSPTALDIFQPRSSTSAWAKWHPAIGALEWMKSEKVLWVFVLNMITSCSSTVLQT